MREITIELPAHIEGLLEASIFDLEDSVDPTALNKYLFYMPEVTRVYGLAIVQLKEDKRKLERQLELRQSEVLIDIANAVDSQKYKNEQMRTAKVVADEKYQSIKTELAQVESAIEENQEHVWKYKNLMNALDNIARLRVSENRY